MKDQQALFAALASGKELFHKETNKIYGMHSGKLLKYTDANGDDGETVEKLPDLEPRNWEIYEPSLMLKASDVKAVLEKHLGCDSDALATVMAHLGFKAEKKDA